MNPIGFIKASPTSYVIQYQNGTIRRQGPGLSFFYWRPTASLVIVPMASADVPFAFNEVTADFQPVTLQGQLTFRVADPKGLASLLDYSVRPDGGFRSSDPELLKNRLVLATQVLARAAVQRLNLGEALVGTEAIVAEVLRGLRADETVSMMGLEILGLSLVSVKPMPETARALEASAREALLRRADEAVYARRNAAVDEERTIKENELATEKAIEERKRAVRETQMQAEISVEEQREALVRKRSDNDRKEAETKAYGLEAMLKPVRDVDWRILTAVGAGGGDPRAMIALAFREIAQNAQKIGELNVSPELLASLLRPPPRGAQP